MPLYEYECSACGHHFEVIRKFSDPPEEKCPKCGGAVRKLQSAPAFQFKGTGWYVTDYAKSGQPEGKAQHRRQEGKGRRHRDVEQVGLFNQRKLDNVHALVQHAGRLRNHFVEIGRVTG